MSEYNLYCDESNHLVHSTGRFMTLGFISCEKKDAKRLNIKIREIKNKHGINKKTELKWTKISMPKIELYKDIVKLFCEENINFRCIIADKKDLDPKRFEMNHDDWYYRMYHLLLGKTLDMKSEYHIYIDKKDTCSKIKVKKLHEVLNHSYYSFKGEMIKNIQQIESHEVELMQLCDILIGAIGYHNNGLKTSKAKLELIKFIESQAKWRLHLSTSKESEKFNLFKWEGR